MLDVDARMAHWMGDRFGMATRAGLRVLGLTDQQIDDRCSAGVLERMHPAVYRHAAAPSSAEGEILAAVLAGGPCAWASGRSAMVLFGCRGEWSGRPEITVLGHDHVELDGVDVRNIDRIEPHDHRRHLGIPVLAPPLALLLLGAKSSERQVHVAVHDLVFQGLTTRPLLLDVLARYGGRGRRGTAHLRRAAKSLDGGGRSTQSNLELDLVRMLDRHGFPKPQLQLPVTDAGGQRYKLDLAFVEHLLDLETDGDRWHLNVHDRARDRRRDRALQALGWEVQRYGSADVHVAPARMLAAIRRALAERALAA